MKKGFAIYCPHCLEWSEWSDDPEEYILTPKAVEEMILPNVSNPEFRHKGLFKCLRGSCPAPFQAVIMDNSTAAHAMVQGFPSWAPGRASRLHDLSKDLTSRYANLFVLLVNCQPVPRPFHIDLDWLLDQDLLSKALYGIAQQLNAPLTIFEAKVPDSSTAPFWVPVEAYSEGESYFLPPRFNSFCEICRKATTAQLGQKFNAIHKRPPPNCPEQYSSYCRANYRRLPCAYERNDWNRCFLFLEERKKLGLCYSSDCNVIEQVHAHRDGLRESAEKESHDGHGPHVEMLCWAGLTELAVPIIVHEHLVAVLMTGQYLTESSQLESLDQKLVSLPALQRADKDFTTELRRARDVLLGKVPVAIPDEGRSKAFVIRKEALAPIADVLIRNARKLEELANARYRHYRASSDRAFRQELVGTLEASGPESNLDKLLFRLLQRMCEYWAYRRVVLLAFDPHTRDLFWWLAWSNEPGLPGTIKKDSTGKIRTFKETLLQKHPLSYKWQNDGDAEILNPWMNELLRFLTSSSLESDSPFRAMRDAFIVAAPTEENVFVTVFVNRDHKCLSPLQKSKGFAVSRFCQEAIQETVAATSRRLAFELAQRLLIARNRILSGAGVAIGLRHEITAETYNLQQTATNIIQALDIGNLESGEVDPNL